MFLDKENTIMESETMPKYSWNISDILYEEDVRKIYESATTREQRVLVSLLWITAARPKEILNLKREDFLISEDIVEVRVETLKLKDTEKFQDKYRTPKFERNPASNMNIYLETIVDWVLDAAPGGFILPRTTRWAELQINKLGEKAIGKKICPYHFRHSVLSWLAKEGYSVPALMHFKGARSIKSVEPYLHAVPYLVKLSGMDRRRIRINEPEKVVE